VRDWPCSTGVLSGSEPCSVEHELRLKNKIALMNKTVLECLKALCINAIFLSY
jgi:hypothetical protein